MKKRLTIGLAAALTCGAALGEDLGPSHLYTRRNHAAYAAAFGDAAAAQALGRIQVAQAMANTDPAVLAGRRAAAAACEVLGDRVMKTAKRSLESKAKTAAKVAIRKQPREDYKSYRERAKEQTEKFVEGYLAYIEDFKECVEAKARTGLTIRPPF